MKISMEALVVGQEYSRPKLAEIWGYDGFQALGMGIFTPGGDNKIVLFITDKGKEAEEEGAEKEEEMMDGCALDG